MNASLPETAVCLNCGYALRGLPNPVCPECGRGFDPANPDTYRDRARPRWSTRFARPPRLWEIVLVVIPTLSLLDSISLGGASTELPGAGQVLTACAFLSMLATPFLLPALVALYWIRLLSVRHVSDASKSLPKPARSGRRWRWFVLPACAALLISALIWPWPAGLRFAPSKAAFNRATRKIAETGTIPAGNRWIGLYQVESVETDGQRTLYCIGNSMIDPVYLVHDPAPGNPGHPGILLDEAGMWYIEED